MVYREKAEQKMQKTESEETSLKIGTTMPIKAERQRFQGRI